MIGGYSFIILAVALGGCIAEDPSLHTHWNTFKKAFSKKFESTNHESAKRLHWEKNVKSILEHNLKADMGQLTYKKAVNEYTDYTQEEIETKLCGLKFPNYTLEFKTFPQEKKLSARAPLPANFDWRSSNAVTSVKNQGSCGSCWSFAVAGALEGLWSISSGQSVDLSEQQLLDCSSSYGTTGCKGGWPDDAYRYVIDSGISSYSCYPYENVVKQCRYDQKCRVANIVNYYHVPRGDEKELKDHLYNHGPISVTISVNNNFSAYTGGIYYDNTCTKAVNHAVLLVGYGTENGVDFWTIKNSWGSGWGEQGYIRMARNRNNLCQIANYATFPSLQ